MKTIFAAAFLLNATAALAADKVLILGEQEQIALRQILDAAIRQSGLNQLSRNALIISDKLDAAGTLTEPTKEKEPPK